MQPSHSFSDTEQGSIPFDQIRKALSITYLWKRLGLRGEPGRSVCSPFRKDTRPSFSVYRNEAEGHELFNDFGEPDCHGDVIDFYQLAMGVDKVTAAKACHEIAFGEPINESRQGVKPAKREKQIDWPKDMHRPNNAECRELERLRDLYAGAFDLAGQFGLLVIGTAWAERCWIVRDYSGRVGEARRMDGKLFDNKDKARALSGSKKNIPVGAVTKSHNFNQLNKLVLVEGAPDLMAAFAIAVDYPHNFRPMAMLGSADNIKDCDFRGDEIVIIGHNDQPGQEAVNRWVQQLYAQGAENVITAKLDPEFKDLNEFVTRKTETGGDVTEILPWHQLDKIKT